MITPFESNFIGGVYTKRFVSMELMHDNSYGGKRLILEIIEMLDEHARSILYPRPTDETVRAYYDRVLETPPWCTPPVAPWIPDEKQILPQPIWTCVQANGEYEILVTRVYGGRLRNNS
jgi:hypothetical protein